MKWFARGWFARLGMLVTGIAAAWPFAALAQTYPSRPITMVVPFAAGGAFDVMGRIWRADGELLGQPVIVENTTGAGGIVGVTRVIAAEPDGYTLLLGTIGTHAYNQTIYKKRRYDAVERLHAGYAVLRTADGAGGAQGPAGQHRPRIRCAPEKNGAKMQYGSAGAGSTTHLACSLLNAGVGVNVTHVPYRGSAPAMNDLLGGQIDYVCGNLGAAAPFIAGKQVKALALLSKERSPLMPDLADRARAGARRL